MAHNRLQHYLRTFRRRHGFSQTEIAVLLGVSSGTKVSRYERFKRSPSVTTVFAYQIIFSAPTRDIFAGLYEAVHRDVRERAKQLIKTLEADAETPLTSKKLHLLRTIVESEPKAAT